jgi:Rieske Fe-S protein
MRSQTGDMDPGDMDPGDMDPGDIDPGDIDPGDIDPGDIDQPPDAPTPHPPDAQALAASALTDPTRRTVLGLVGAVGAGGLLAACGGGGDTSSSETSSAQPPADSSSSASSRSGEAGGGGGAGAALAKTSQVPVKGGKVLDGPKIVVTQPAQGDFKAFTAVCTHQACTVGIVENNVITCPCHGSQYSAEDGSVERGPANGPLKAIGIKVEGDQIVKA